MKARVGKIVNLKKKIAQGKVNMLDCFLNSELHRLSIYTYVDSTVNSNGVLL